MAYEKIKTETYRNLGGINTKVSSYIQGPEEFKRLVNLNFSIPGSLTKRPGTTLSFGATVTGRITGIYEFERISGASYTIATANTNAYNVSGGSFNPFLTGLTNGAIFDFQTFVDRLFLCNGGAFQKYDGTNAYPVGLPGPSSIMGVAAAAGGSFNIGATTTFIFSYAFVNERGYIGPLQNGVTLFITVGDKVNITGLSAPSGFGISSILLFRSGPNSVDLYGTTYVNISSSTASDLGFPLQLNQPSNNNLYFTLSPKYIEIYNNQLFMAGFSSQLSTMYWSEIGEPEAIDPTYFAEVRTNDGDIITSMKAYQSDLVITKDRSFHRLTGDNPANFLLQQVSDQYGCLSNRAIVTFENYIWFLDSKGVVEYNGANVEIVSNKVEPIFASMNLTAARENACAIHYRQANEVWFAIPCNGATFNNCIVIYDYLTKAWTTYEGVNPSSLAMMSSYIGVKTPFIGGYTGNIFHFGASFTADNGQGFTCLAQSRFICPLGQSTEEQYRRLFLNINPIPGSSQAININLYTNYGSSVMLNRTMYQNPFQSRIDFGLPARSLSVECSHYSATLPFRLDGFVLESRYQRNV